MADATCHEFHDPSSVINAFVKLTKLKNTEFRLPTAYCPLPTVSRSPSG
jgi:hypothetical protein